MRPVTIVQAALALALVGCAAPPAPVTQTAADIETTRCGRHYVVHPSATTVEGFGGAGDAVTVVSRPRAVARCSAAMVQTRGARLDAID